MTQLDQLKKALPAISRASFSFDAESLRANGQPLTDESRKELLAKAVAREDVSLDLEVLAFEQRVGQANRNFVRFRDGAVIALGNSGAGKPFLADHNKWSLDARLGTIVSSVGKKRGEGDYCIQMTVRLTDPSAVEKALRGLMSTVSIGWTPTGPIECSVHGTEIWTECYCYPGTRLAEVTDATGKKKYVRDRKGAAIVEWVYTSGELTECSAVNVPAVPGAHIERVRAALSEAGISDDEVSALIALESDESTRLAPAPQPARMETKIVVLTEAQGAYLAKLAASDRDAFLAATDAERTALVAAALAADAPIWTGELTKVSVRKSDGPLALSLAQSNEQNAVDRAAMKSQLDAANSLAARQALRSRAASVLAGLHGSDEVHDAILAAVESIADATLRAAAEQSLNAWRAGGRASVAPGVNPELAAQPDDPSAKLEALVAAEMTAKGSTRAVATAAVTKTAAGSALYTDIQKAKKARA